MNACRFIHSYALKWYEARRFQKSFRGSNFVQKSWLVWRISIGSKNFEFERQFRILNKCFYFLTKSFILDWSFVFESQFWVSTKILAFDQICDTHQFQLFWTLTPPLYFDLLSKILLQISNPTLNTNLKKHVEVERWKCRKGQR